MLMQALYLRSHKGTPLDWTSQAGDGWARSSTHLAKLVAEQLNTGKKAHVELVNHGDLHGGVAVGMPLLR